MRNDRWLARRAARGDRDAFAAIFQRHQQDLYRYCAAILGNSEDAQDALQNTMVKALRSLPGERREVALKPWLYRVAHNEAIELRRRERPSEPFVEEDAPGLASLEQSAAERERLRALLDDLDHLPDRHRGALVMRELSGLDFEEIAAALETSPRAARQVLYEARRGLAEMSAGREMACEEIAAAISADDRRSSRRRDIRAHLRDCAGCREFAAEIEGRRETLAGIAPLSAVAAAALWKGALVSGGGALGGAGGAGGAGTAGTGAAGTSAGAAAGAAAKAGSAATLVKSAIGVVAVVAVGAVAADHSRLIDLGGGSGSRSTPAASAPRSAGEGGAGAAGSGSGTTSPAATVGRRQAAEAVKDPAASRKGVRAVASAAAVARRADVSERQAPGHADEAAAPPGAEPSTASAEAPETSSANVEGESSGRDAGPSNARGAERSASGAGAEHPPHPAHPSHAKPAHPAHPEPAAPEKSESTEATQDETAAPTSPKSTDAEAEATEVAAEVEATAEPAAAANHGKGSKSAE